MTEQEAKAEAKKRWPDNPDYDATRIKLGRLAFVEGAEWERSRVPVQVEVTADMVERAAMVLYGDYRSEHEGARLSDFQDVARAVLSAALGGGE